MTRFVLDIDDSQWKADHLPRVLRTAESEWLNELACQVEIQITDARPLIVLDITVADSRLIVANLRDHGYDGFADQIAGQTKPARILEPTKSGTLVTANLIVHDNVVVELMRLNVDRDLPWVVVNRFGAQRVQCGWQFAWDGLDNQKVTAS